MFTRSVAIFNRGLHFDAEKVGPNHDMGREGGCWERRYLVSYSVVGLGVDSAILLLLSLSEDRETRGPSTGIFRSD